MRNASAAIVMALIGMETPFTEVPEKKGWKPPTSLKNHKSRPKRKTNRGKRGEYQQKRARR